MQPRTEGRAGFTLIEAAVALAVVAILAGSIAPLAVQALKQQREYRTRDSLKTAFEALFGARDRRVGNMLADFGFWPNAGTANLAYLLDRNQLPGSTAAGAYGPGASPPDFYMGWNGPYWNGATDGNGNPADAWGKPIRLIRANGGWQVASNGPDGFANTADDLFYPAKPALDTSLKCLFGVNITMPLNKNGSYTVYFREQGQFNSSLPVPLDPLKTFLSVKPITLMPAGPVQISFTLASGSADPVIVDLLPGEVRIIDVSLP